MVNSPARRGSVAVVAAAALVLAQISVSAQAQQATCDVAGQWKTSFGLLNVMQREDGLVSGVYQSPRGQGRLEGQIAEDRVEVTWSEPPSFIAPEHAGSGYFEISKDCASLSGEFRKGSEGPLTETWRGKRLSSAAKVPNDEILPTEISKRADQLTRIAASLSNAEQQIPKTRFDVAAVYAEVGNDPAALRSWVAAETHIVPYRGLLRGPVGVLMDRHGNSLDRALLLASLLNMAGHEVRLARASLDEAMTALLLTLPAPSAAEPQAASRSDVEFIPAFAEDTGVDPALVKKVLEDMQAASAELTETVKSRVQTQVPMLLEALVPVVETARNAHSSAVAALADHWWVQRKEGVHWIDLELSTPDGAALKPAEATFAPDAIPEEFHHKATVRLTVEYWQAGALRQEVVLDGKLRPADLPGTVVTLTHTSTTVGAPSSIDPAMDPEALFQESTRETTWLPMLKTIDGYFFNRTFSVSGETAEADDPYLSALAKSLETARQMGETQAETFKVLTDPLNLLLDPGESTSKPEPQAATDKLTAEWLDIIMTVPGEAPVVHRRTIFDLVGADARASQLGAEPMINENAKRHRALALANTIDLLFLPADPPIEQLAAIVAQSHAAAFVEIAKALRAVAAGQAVFPTADLPRAPVALYALSTLRWDAKPGRAYYIDRTNVLLLRHGLRSSPSGGLREFTQIDIVENSVGVDPSLRDSAFRLQLMQGVADTAAEAALLDSPHITNVSELFERDRAAGKAWLLVTDAVMADRLPLASGDRQRIAAAIRNGNVVLVRPEPIEAAGVSGAVWWRVNASTGATLGIGPDGAGQTTSEYSAAVFDVSWRVVNIGVCIAKSVSAGTNLRKQTGAIVCMFAQLIGVIAQSTKLMNMHFNKITKAASSGAIDWAKNTGTALGTGGTLVAW
jgi:hypothetical protein